MKSVRSYPSAKKSEPPGFLLSTYLEYLVAMESSPKICQKLKTNKYSLVFINMACYSTILLLKAPLPLPGSLASSGTALFR